MSKDKKHFGQIPEHFYGVRSYLNNFYELQADKFNEDDSNNPVWKTRKSLIPEKPFIKKDTPLSQNNSKMKSQQNLTNKNCFSSCLRDTFQYLILSPICFRACIILGTTLLLTGISLIVYGFFFAKQMPVILRADDIEKSGDPQGLAASQTIQTQIKNYINHQISKIKKNNSSKNGESPPPSSIAELYEENKLRKNILVVDTYAIAHNRILKWVRMGGLTIFFGSALGLCLCILFSLFHQQEDSSLLYSTTSIRKRIGDDGRRKVKKQQDHVINRMDDTEDSRISDFNQNYHSTTTKSSAYNFSTDERPTSSFALDETSITDDSFYINDPLLINNNNNLTSTPNKILPSN